MKILFTFVLILFVTTGVGCSKRSADPETQSFQDAVKAILATDQYLTNEEATTPAINAGWKIHEESSDGKATFSRLKFVQPAESRITTISRGEAYLYAVTRKDQKDVDYVVMVGRQGIEVFEDAFTGQPSSIKQYGYNGGLEFIHGKVASSAFFTDHPETIAAGTLVNSITWADLETNPYSVMVVDVNADMPANEWNWLIGSLVLVGNSQP